VSSETPSPPGSKEPRFASVIAIDGPVASGKSSIGRRLAERLGGYRFVDTGMMYRAVTWLALDGHEDLPDDEELAALARGATIRLERRGDGSPVLFLNGEDVTGHLRDPNIDHSVPMVSEVRGVRQAMVPHQRAMAAEGRLVMVGRDIGSEVLTDAPLKVYLTASAEERARRRHAELALRGDTRSLSTILEEVLERDRIDMGREVSPLLPPDTARLPEGTLLLPTDDLTETEVVDRIYEAAALP
jgi:cytidylate kinase